MKKVEANRYPHSATLFKFCKEALAIRYDGNVKVIDQDVGAILGYDPADCSHWKKGKKNIRALSTLRSIADHLNVDERLLIDIASGRVDLDEAVFEFRGYGNFSLTGKSLENLKKEYFRNPTRWESEAGTQSFEELFAIHRDELVGLAGAIVSQANFIEAPVYIPELLQLVPGLAIRPNEELKTDIEIIVSDDDQKQKTIYYRGEQMRPYLRFLVAREVFLHLIDSKNPLTQNMSVVPDEVRQVQANIFAGMLLIPSTLLRAEVDRIDSSLDLVSQLADTFWVSKALMNQRLRDYLEYLS